MRMKQELLYYHRIHTRPGLEVCLQLVDIYRPLKFCKCISRSLDRNVPRLSDFMTVPALTAGLVSHYYIHRHTKTLPTVKTIMPS